MADESKPKVPPPSLTKPKPPSQPLPDPPTDAPPPDPATTPDPHGVPKPPGPPPEEERGEVSNPELDPAVPPAEPGSLAPLQTRLVAALIDAVVATGLYLVVALLLPEAIEGLIAWLVFAAYWIARDSLAPLNGQSLGKTAMKLKAVKLDGGDLINDWKTALIRNVILVVPVVSLVELIVIIVRNDGPDRGRRLGDEWAKTKVIATS